MGAREPVRTSRVAIIILNWNGWQDTIECLESLYRIDYPCYDVVVVDNCSVDESVEMIREYCEGRIKVNSMFFEHSWENKPIHLIEYTREEAELGVAKSTGSIPPSRRLILIKNERNFGFAEGNNIAIRYCLKVLKPEYVVLLNNDTVVDVRFLSELVKVAEQDESIGVLGPKIYYYDFDGRRDVLWFAGGKIDVWREMLYRHVGIGEVDEGQYDEVRDVDWITGCAIMLSTALLATRQLNPEYFFGNEDVEYCVEARREGYRVVYVPSSKVWHKVGISRGKRKESFTSIRNIPDYFTLIRRNFPRWVYYYHLLLLGAVLPRWALLYLIRYRDMGMLMDFMRNMARLIRGR